MSDRIDDVTIVGGGDAGLITALAIRQFNPGVGITVVDDFESEIPPIGKSTFLGIRPALHDHLDVDERRFIAEVKPIWKASAYFTDWCGNEPFHYPFDAGSKFPAPDTPNAYEDYYLWYDELHADPEYRTICEEMVAGGKSPWHYDARRNNYDRYDRTAYHLDTDRFNRFLREICRERNVSLVNDVITEVERDGNRIETVRSKSQAYGADLYVDASGFARVITGDLEREIRDFPIPLDSAFATQVDNDLADVVPATIHETGEHGWFWHIDTYDHLDLGYVYASEFVSDEEAESEFRAWAEQFGIVDEVASFSFDSGYYTPPWDENCIVVGNAAGNVEALESTGLSFSAQAAVRLGRLLGNHGRVFDDAVRETYNDWVIRGWESLFDFITVHYRYVDPENEFWAAMADVPVSRRVEVLEEAFDENGLDRTVDPTENHPEVEPLAVYNHMDFYLLMRHLGETSEFYETAGGPVSEDVREKKAEIQRQISGRVDGFLTTEEMYREVFETVDVGASRPTGD